MAKTYHFIGIKGSGMSALALMLHQMGHKVQGSDVEKYYFTQRGLEQAGIKILPFDEKNLQGDIEIIAGNAFRPDNNVEIAYADKNGLSYKRYHEFLGSFMRDFISMGVAGAHGKTSTTGMLSHVLSHITDTSYLIGDGTGRGSENAKYFVFESDEYERHFMPYHPEYSIITNIDFDHPDYYTDIEDVQSAFEAFGKQVKKGIIACGDDERLRTLDAIVPVTYYGVGENNDVIAKNIRKEKGGSYFDAYIKGELYGHFYIPTYGDHNILNALAIIAFYYLNDLDRNELAEQFSTFGGVKRRFSEKVINGVTIIDDYAHHPSEIRATLDAARQKYPDKEVVAVFQPHTFTRTIALLEEFAAVLSLADHVYLCDIFASVREEAGDVSIEDLAKLVKGGAKVLPLDNVSPLLNYKDAVIVFMGAGDVQKYEFAYEKLLSNTSPTQN